MDSSRACMRACRGLKLALATAALTLGLSGVALAGTTSSTPTTVTFTGDAGELNNVLAGYDTASPGGPYIVVQEQNRSIANTAGPGCSNTNPNNAAPDSDTVWCGATGITNLVLNGGDLNDFLGASFFGYFTGPGFANGSFPPGLVFAFNGGDGNDGIGLPPGTTVNGTGPGGTANGDAGNDTIAVVDGQTANGGDGDDTLNANGPFVGEKPPFTTATLNGNAGNDVLNGNGGTGANTPDSLNGNEGDDGLFPGSGPEDLNGGPGGDLVNWNGGPGNGVNVSLDNVANDGTGGQKANAHSDIETLLGSGGAPDVLTGAPGVPNFVDGFGGNDTFNVASNPPDPDIVVCGDGFVTINADVLDSFDTSGPTGCRGTINRPPTGAVGPRLSINSKTTKLDSDGHITFTVGCRGNVRCRGILEVDQGSSVIGTAQFVIANGKSKKVDILPRPNAAKRLKKGKSIKSTVTVDATDNANAAPTTVSRNVTIKGKKKKKPGA